MLDQVQRYNLGAYFEQWRANMQLREAMEYRGRLEEENRARLSIELSDMLAEIDGPKTN
jgi:hypothetical protein